MSQRTCRGKSAEMVGTYVQLELDRSYFVYVLYHNFFECSSKILKTTYGLESGK